MTNWTLTCHFCKAVAPATDATYEAWDPTVWDRATGGYVGPACPACLNNLVWNAEADVYETVPFAPPAPTA